MSTSTELRPPISVERAHDELAGRASRVWRAPRPPRATYAAAIAAGALIVGGVTAMDRLDDGPRADVAGTPAGSLAAIADQVGARALWAQGITGAGVNVALVDTGVAPVEALSSPGKVRATVDLSAEASDPALAGTDSFGHGTHLAGIIAGHTPGIDPSTTGSDGFLGIAPDAGIVSVKVAGRDGDASPTQVAAGVDWVVAHADELDIDVLAVAFDSGTSLPNDPVAAAVERAWDAGIVVVTAAGNGGVETTGLHAPASVADVIAVGGVEGTTSGFEVADWTSQGDGARNPDLAAPGAHVRSLRAPGSAADVDHPEGFVDDELFLGSGSSQSAAVVAAASALLLSAHPELTNGEVKQLLVNTTRAIDAESSRVGSGVLDVAAAYAAAASLDPSWTGSSWTGSSWTGSSWTGSSWTGSSWTGSSWTGSSWTGSSWTGSSWTGSSWTGSSWTGSSWTGSSWTGSSWTGSSWTGSSWTGSSWTGSSWTGSSWTGSSWTGSSWTGSSWT